MRHWNIKLSYLPPVQDRLGRRWRQDASVGVLAETLQRAIELAIKSLPTGATEPIVWSAHHLGKVDVMDVAKHSDE